MIEVLIRRSPEGLEVLPSGAIEPLLLVGLLEAAKIVVLSSQRKERPLILPPTGPEAFALAKGGVR